MKIYLITVLLVISSKVLAQSDVPPSWRLELDTSVNFLNTDSYEIINEPTDDSQLIKTEILRFANKYNVSKTIGSLADAYILPDNSGFIHRIGIKSTNAKTINLELNNIDVVEGDKLYFYSRSHKQLRIMNYKELSTRKSVITKPIDGDEVIIELYSRRYKSDFNIYNINHDFIGIFGIEIGNFGASGSCQVDVACDEGDPWHKEERSVCLLIINGSEACSGALINNTNEDGRPLVLTANHCYDFFNTNEESFSNAVTTTEFLFNYNSPWCNGPNGSDNDIIIGATQRARNIQSDMILLEMDQFPPTEFYTYYSGWDRINTQPPTGVGIHHPRGDVKKIVTHNITPNNSNCMDFDLTDFFGGTIGFMPNSNYWRINWMATTNGFSVTENTSSGSPLFNANHRIIGQLFGSGLCDNPNCTDPTNDIANYGKIFSSWLFGGTPNTSLNSWLDPIGLSPSDYFGLRLIRFYTVDHNAWFTGDVVKFHDVNVLPGHDVVVTELQDRFEATGTLDIPAGVTFRVDKP